jgi:hypothetical protein
MSNVIMNIFCVNALILHMNSNNIWEVDEIFRLFYVMSMFASHVIGMLVWPLCWKTMFIRAVSCGKSLFFRMSKYV